MPFKLMGLADPLIQGILATGYTAPTEIQSQAIPAILKGKDIIGCAQTGTGKTAAFALPILNMIETQGPDESVKKQKARALIITPTRELALQNEQAVRNYGRFMRVKTLAVYGGTRIEANIKFLRGNVDVVAATPGRLLDLLQRKAIDLSHIKILVLDEADRMFDMGFIKDIQKIVNNLPHDRQTLLFSATMPAPVKKLTRTIQKNPKTIQIGKIHNPVETISQKIMPVSNSKKTNLLVHLIKEQNMYSVLVFSRTKHGADRICRNLKKADIKSVAIHSGRTQKQRLNALGGFKSSKFQVMVATDIAARGINVEGISHVINFDVPAYAEDYVHRIGRTGRAQATGEAITFVSEDEMKHLFKIEKFIERQFDMTQVEGFTFNAGPKKKQGKKSSKKSTNKNSNKTVSKSRSGKSSRSKKTTGPREHAGSGHKPANKKKKFSTKSKKNKSRRKR